MAIEAGKLVHDTLRSIYPLSPFRKPPSRWYIFAGSEVRNVGFDGELLPDLLFRSPSLVSETNRWLESSKPATNSRSEGSALRHGTCTKFDL